MSVTRVLCWECADDIRSWSYHLLAVQPGAVLAGLRGKENTLFPPQLYHLYFKLCLLHLEWELIMYFPTRTLERVDSAQPCRPDLLLVEQVVVLLGHGQAGRDYPVRYVDPAEHCR